MAQTDMLRRYLDAGIAFTKMTQERAEAIVRDLVGAGEVGADQASSAVQDLVDRSRENTERLLETVRQEISAQAGNLGLATRDEIESLRAEIAELRERATSSPPAPAPARRTPAPRAKAAAPRSTTTKKKAAPSKATPRKAAAPRKAAGRGAGAAVKLPATKAPSAKKAARRSTPAKRS